MTTAGTVVQRRRRRRWPLVVLVLLLLIALLVVAAEFVARPIVADSVRDLVAEPLGVDSASDVDVDLGDGSVLQQLAAGHLTVVTATTDDAEVAGLAARIRVVARNVTLADGQAGSVRAEIAVPSQKGLTALVSKDVDARSVRFSGGRLVVATSVSVLGQSLDAVEKLSVSADAGRLVFTPRTLTVAGLEVDLDGLRRGPLASALSGLTKPQTQCLNESLPQGLALKSAELDGSTLRLVTAGIQLDLDTADRGSCT